MATMDDLKTVMESVELAIVTQTSVIMQLVNTQETAIAEQKRANELSRAGRSSSGGSGGGSLLGGLFGGARSGGGGGGGGGIGGRLIGGAAGIGAMGLAIPAFFGGLMAGDAGLGWLGQFGSGFDFTSLKAAALGFSDIITEMDTEAFLVLAGIMGISAIGGVKAAAGLGAMGFAISAFFGGLLAGDLVFSNVTAVDGSYNFSGLKSVAIGFSDVIMSMDPGSMKVLAGILGLSAVTGLIGKDSTGAAKALGSMGLGISAFFGGLLAGDALFSGVEALGGNLDLNGLKTVLEGFSSSIDALTPKAAIALAGIMGGAGLASAFDKGTGVNAALSYAAIMTGIGAGIAGLMGGLVVGSAGIEWLQKSTGMTGEGLVSAFNMFDTSIGSLSKESATALASIIGASGVAAAFGGGIGLAASTAAIMTGIGAGISGLMIGLSAGSSGIEWINNATNANGSGLVNAFKMFNDSVGELNNENAIKALGAILIAGAAIGAIGGPAVAGMAGLGIFAIMTGIGAGISGLMVGLAAGDFITSYLQQFKGEGEGISGVFKTFNDSILAITPEAIERLKKLTELGGFKIAGALTGLSAGVVAFLGAEGLGKLAGTLSEAFYGVLDSVFGTDYSTDSSKGIISAVLEGLEPIDDFNLDKINEFSDGLNNLTLSFQNLSSLSVGSASSNLANMVKDIGGLLSMWPHLMGDNPEPFDPRGWKAFGRDKIDFGGGLRNLNPNDIELLSQRVNEIRSALNSTMDNVNAVSSANSLGANGTAQSAYIDNRVTNNYYNGGDTLSQTSINASSPELGYTSHSGAQ